MDFHTQPNFYLHFLNKIKEHKKEFKYELQVEDGEDVISKHDKIVVEHF